jgi:hypothetical protein
MCPDRYRSVADLIHRCSRRPADEAAWQEFVRRFHTTIQASVNRTLGLIGGNTFQAQDMMVEEIIQSIYLRLVEEDSLALRESACDCAASLHNYLAMLAVRTVRDRFCCESQGLPN